MSVTAAIAIANVLKDPFMSVLDRFFPDKAKAKEAADALTQVFADNAHEINKLQLEVIKAEANHPSMFVAGARPATLWICNIALLNNFIIMPYIQLLSDKALTLDMATLMPIMLTLLGVGGFRTVEKMKGVARENMMPQEK